MASGMQVAPSRNTSLQSRPSAPKAKLSKAVVGRLDDDRVVVLQGGARSAGFPFQIEAAVAVGDLVLLPTKAPFLSLDYVFVARRGRALSPAAKAFMTLAREVERGKGASYPNVRPREASAQRA